LPDEAADWTDYETLIDLPEQAPEAVDTDAVRGDLNARGTKPIIPPKSNSCEEPLQQETLRMRNWIERVIGYLKTNRALATRYEQLAESFLGMLYLAAARYSIKFVHAAWNSRRRRTSRELTDIISGRCIADNKRVQR
jgi:Transposase DDE domain